jgi:hypothetical protein
MADALRRMIEGLPPSFFADERHRKIAKTQTILGGVFTGVAGIGIVAALLTRSPLPLTMSIGPLVAGSVNLSIGLHSRRQIEGEARFDLSDDARALIAALRSRASTALVIVPAPLEALLNEFAAAHGALKSIDAETSPHGVRARLAADEAAAEAFNLAARAIRRPDEGYEDGIRALVASVREAASRLAPSHWISGGSLGALLADLRDEAKARQELGG